MPLPQALFADAQGLRRGSERVPAGGHQADGILRELVGKPCRFRGSSSFKEPISQISFEEQHACPRRYPKFLGYRRFA